MFACQRWRYKLPLRLRSIFRSVAVDRDMDEELRFHLECEADEGMSRDLDACEAHYSALRALGGLEQRKEEIRDMRRVRWFSDLVTDVNYALRAIGHSKLFSLLVVLTLGLGIGANSAIFSLADAVLLRPLPVVRPSEVVSVSTLSPSSSAETVGPVSYRDYLDYRDHSKSFEGLAAFSFALNFGFATYTNERPKMAGGLFVSGNLFRVMDVEPALGRGFNAGEDSVPGRNPVVVLANDFWQKQFASDRSVIGRHIFLDGVEFSIIGVAPAKFSGLNLYDRPDVFVPLMMWPRLMATPGRNLLEDRADRELMVKGRLKPGIPIAQARAELRVIAANLQRAYPKTNRNQNVAVRTELAMRLQSDPTDAALAGVLLALAAAVLLIACANVAGLLLSRARSRSREIAVRLAIGAGRFRLVRLLLAESLVVALLGGVVGLALGYGGVRFFGRYEIATDMPMRLSVQLDRRVLLFSLAVSLLSAILCGLAPALQTTRMNLVTALKTADADLSGRRRLWGRNTLVIAQVAISLALLTAALQLVRTFQQKWREGPGFRTDHLLTMTFDPELVRFTEAQTQKFYRDLVRRARLLPGVKSAALTGELPMSNDPAGVSVVPDGYQMPAGREGYGVDMDVVDESYFPTLGVRLLRGRGFRESDTATSARVAVVNEQFAKRFWPGKDALGKRFRIDGATGALVEIVGVTKTAKYEWLGEPPTDFVYLPLSQRARAKLTLLAESTGPPETLIEPLRALVQNLDAGQPVLGVRTIKEFYTKRVISAPVMILQAVSAMGLVGLILAIAGLYGVVSYSANRRTREIGIRMAIGADSHTVLRMVLRQAVILVAGGIGIGLLLGVVAERGVNAVFQTSKIDVGAFLLVLPLLLGVTMLAAFIPARRASRTEPTRALRYE